ncbi:DUF559 domain-containing protein [Cryobacterium melibiosiphilum]|uniref:DUF559 domain-containing protein n=1 Tax=Cryobacterium melibiosiphilum TaxID=995039 RepID=A0A3A5MC09_9MICO|nr:DUF559 domain-containing protein [Cryobacterium melibiosiphilum]RJT85104.1 DUF559 domain-containing protein [Cryobacterium melibiosiphilum]
MNRSLAQDLARFGNLATRSQLRTLGYTDRDLRRAMAAQELWPLGRSWLAHRGVDHDALRAVALHGRLAAESSLANHGVWVTRPTGLWIGTALHSGHAPATGANEHRIWVNERFPRDTDVRWRMSVPDSLLQFAALGEGCDVVASMDSALNKGLVTPAELERVIAAVPRRLRRLLGRVDGRAQSGLETLLRLAAEAEGWNVRIQVVISGVGRVDVLIDGWLVIELDGARWHDDEQSRDEDSRRDAELTLLGYRYHRFRSRQVLEEMPLCLAVIRTILASGRPLVAA